MSVNITQFIEKIDDPVLRKALEALANQSVTVGDVANFISTTDFSMSEVSGGGGGGGVIRLDPINPEAVAGGGQGSPDARERQPKPVHPFSTGEL